MIQTLAGKTVREIRRQRRAILNPPIPNSFHSSELRSLINDFIIRGGKKPHFSIPLLCHDDQLVMRGQKHEVGLNADWRKRLGKGETTRYWNPKNSDNLPPTGLLPPGYFACAPRFGELFKGVSIEAKDSYIDFRINTLWEDLRSRYRLCLEVLEAAGDRGILEYNPHTLSHFSRTRRREAFRHKLKNVWCISSYEHNLVIFDSEIGQTLLTELATHDISGTNRFLPSTVYINGFNPNTRPRPTKVVVYDMEPVHGVKAVKIEVCLRDGYLKSHRMDGRDLRRAVQFAQQPDIQELIEVELRKFWRRIFMWTPRARNLLKCRIGIRSLDALLDMMADRSNTYTSIRRCGFDPFST